MTELVANDPVLSHTAVLARIRPVLYVMAAWALIIPLAKGTVLQEPVEFVVGVGCMLYLANHVAKCWQRDRKTTHSRRAFYIYAVVAFVAWPLAISYEMAIAGWGMFRAQAPAIWWKALLWNAVKYTLGFVFLLLAVCFIFAILTMPDGRRPPYDHFHDHYR